jgi:hypothetical protein
MRRLKHVTVSQEIQAAMADHLGPAFHRERQAARRSRQVRYLVVPILVAALAAVLFVLFHHQSNS